VGRPITLFTAQWADLTFDTVCAKAKECGYDGVEIACWGDHFEVDKALESDAYVRSRRDILDKHGLNVWAISTHLVGQAVTDPLDERHKAVLPKRIWGDGKEDGVRARAAEEIKDTARAARKLGIQTVVGFTGSPVWKWAYSFPPNPPDYYEKALKFVADMWLPILDVYQQEGVHCSRRSAITLLSGSISTRATSATRAWTMSTSSMSSARAFSTPT
jgi:sugar phosphate isomerase/epimerase